jgi:hypothetical protein
MALVCQSWLPRAQILLLVATACAAASQARGQTPPNVRVDEIEILTPGTAILGESPPQEVFDYDAWLAGGDGASPSSGWHLQVLPDGILYRAYLANPKESRLGTQIFDEGDRALWDSTLGGRIGLVRFGSAGGTVPEGWQLDMEGSAQVRLHADDNLDLQSVDYRVGAPLTYAAGPQRFKLGYYHLCSHAGDEFLLAHPSFQRLNYVRDTVVLGYAYFLTEELRAYSEAGYAFDTQISEPWEVQFGLELAPTRPTGLRGAPFLAAHGHLRQELDYSGNFTLQAGWAWHSDRSTHLLRTGFHYYNGLSDQYQFFRQFEHQLGAGVWYDY